MDIQSRINSAIFNDQENNMIRGKAGALPLKRGGLGLNVLGEVNSNIQFQRDAAIKKNPLLNIEDDKKAMARALNKSNYSHVQSKVDTGLVSKSCVVPTARAPLRREESTAALAVKAARSKVLRDVTNKSSDTKEARKELKKITSKFAVNKENKITIHKDDSKVRKPVSKLAPSRSKVELNPLEKLTELNISKEITPLKDEPSLPVDIEDIDSKDKNDPFLMSVYIKDIYRYLLDLEEKYPIEENHLKNQVDVTGKMRKTLIDWLVEVQSQFSLLLETFHLTVRIIDRYLQLVPNVKRSKLQLIGVTAMFIASKYEEIYPPEVRDFVYITDNAYSKTEVFQCEREIMNKLGFALSMPIPLSFLRRFIKAAQGTSKNYHLSKYLVDLSLLEYSMAHYRPSEIAAAAICFSIYVLSSNELEDVWTPTLSYYSGYTLQHITPILKEMATVVTGLENSKFKAVTKKYSDKSLAMVAGLPQLRGDSVRELLKLE